MLQIGSLEDRLIHRVFDNEKFHGQTEYMLESEPGPRPAPQAFLATQEADWVLPVHFHRQEQFQVIVSGRGTLGRSKIEPLYVHYASRESGYGPLTAGPRGLQYLTLRAVTDAGAWYLPESRDKMRRIPKRQAHAGPFAVSDAKALTARRGSSIETAIEPDDEGLAGWLVRLGPGQSVQEPTHLGGGGRYLIVAAGQMHLHGRVLHGTACAFASPEEPAQTIVASEQGLEVLVLQFPRSALEPMLD